LILPWDNRVDLFLIIIGCPFGIELCLYVNVA
jgi:hypothetical protein